MATAVRTIRRRQSPASTQDGALQLCPFTPPDSPDLNDIEALSDDESNGRIGAAWIEVAGSDEVVLSICGRDRRLRIL